MTDPVILLGTQSNGETLPVQVDDFGRLVAEGLQGSKGDQGEQGPPGADGGSFPLPPDPYEGALLGWLDGGLAWVGTPPVPIPEGVFGPILNWSANDGLLTVDGEIPQQVGNGVYVFQCDNQGELFTPGMNVSELWRNYGTGTPYSSSNGWRNAFNGVISTQSDGTTTPITDGTMTWTVDIPVTDEVVIYARNRTNKSSYGLRVNRTLWANENTSYAAPHTFTAAQLGGRLTKVEMIQQGDMGVYLSGIRIDGLLLTDTDESLSLRVNQVLGNNIIGNSNLEIDFTVGAYLKVPDQRVAPWVLYGNDPTSLIDHLRRSRD